MLQLMTDLAKSTTSKRGNSRISEEGREIIRKIVKSGALDEALREVDEMELEAQIHEAKARRRKQE